MSEWTPIKLGSIVNITNGFAFKSENFLTSLTFNTLPVLKIKNVANGDVHLKDVQYHLIDSKYDKYTSSKGDILITLTGNHPQALTQVVGAVSKQKFDTLAYINQRVAKIDPISSLAFKDFIYYFLKEKSTHDYLASQSSGSANQANISKADIENVELLLPPVTEQIAIASVLSSLDDKIDLLHRQNKTLESMAETLFRQWFILDSTGVSVSIDQIIDFNPKRTLIKSQDATYLDMAGLSTVIFRANGYYRRPFSSGTKFTKRDTLLARITPCLENGKAAYIDFLDDNETGWGSTEFIVMRPKKEIHPFISYIMCRNPDFKEYAESCMEGSTGRQRVNLDHLKKFNVNLPTEASLRIINELLDSFESKLINNSKQIDSLEKLRDTLLPKLMSGEVRVQYAEEAIASVA